ncbi:MAG: hypothetical protein K2L54_03960, partial [Clostridiales bacterium]|nr:hypothetical protein [Clostridiales bacterium]
VDVTQNYEVDYVYGRLKILPRPITVETASKTFEYDGNEKRTAYPTVKITDTSIYGLADGDHLLPSALYVAENYRTDKDVFSSLTDVDSVANIISVVIGTDNRNATGFNSGVSQLPNKRPLIDYATDVTDDYEIKFVYGTLAVIERAITVEAKSIAKVYNGQPLTGDVYKITSGSLVSGHSGVATLNADYINVGTYNSVTVSSLKIYDGEAEKTSNYKITYSTVTATVVITKRPITIASYGTEDDERYYFDTYWYYDGTPKSFKYCGSQYEYDENGDPHPDKGLVFVYDEENKRYNALHTIVSDDDSWATITDAGNRDNTFTAHITDQDGNDVTGNYAITYEYGTLIVLPRPVTVVTASESFVYNGDPQFNESWSVKNGSLGFVFDHTLKVTSHTKITNVADGVRDNVLTFDVVNADSAYTVKAKLENYDISVEYGELTVLPRELNIVTNSHEWKYDGKTYHDDGWEYAVDSLRPVKDHGLKVIRYTEVKDVMRDENGGVIGTDNVLLFAFT